MPLILAPFTAIAIALFLSAYLKSANMTIKPQLDATGDKKENFLKKTVYAPYRLVAKWVKGTMQKVLSITSHFALAHFPVATRWFHGHTARVNQTAREFSHISNDTADALARLNHVTVPRKIKAQVAPVRRIAVRANSAAAHANARVRNEEKARRRSISLTNKKLGALAGLLLGADLFVFGKHAREHHRFHTRDWPRFRDQTFPRTQSRVRVHGKAIGNHGVRIKRLEKILAGLLGGLLVYRVLAKVAPWLFCRNWKVAGRAICGMNPNALAGLLALVIAGLEFRDIRTIARFAEGITDEAAHLVADLVSVPLHSGGQFTIE